MNFLPVLFKKLFIFLLFFLITIPVFALDTSGVSVSVEVSDEDVQGGHIITLSEGSYKLANNENDENLFGVAVNDPPLVLIDNNLVDSVFVVTSGETLVKVKSSNGDIKAGDYITSSDTPGVGQKAAESGKVIGISLEDFKFEDTETVSEVAVHVDIASVIIGAGARTDLLELLRNGFKVPFLTPLTSLRYIIAALIALISFIIGFASFGRVSNKSIEALGRNPLASRIIKSAIILNFMLTIVIIAVGLSISYLILTL